MCHQRVQDSQITFETTGVRDSQVKDRALVAQRMKAHVEAEDRTPLLIFPEGTCVNNEYCVMFKVPRKKRQHSPAPEFDANPHRPCSYPFRRLCQYPHTN